MSAPHRRGAEHERATARRLGGQRVGNQGHASVDVDHPLWAIECKARQSIPAWIEHALDQATGAATAGRYPIVVVHAVGSRHSRDIVMIRLADFESWSGQLPIWPQNKEASD